MIEQNYISEVSENEFEESVINQSNTSMVLVDFWAPWCGPCKQLTPLLEKIVTNCKGKVKLAKINIDENQQIATQMRIQSIPAVFAFKDGKPVNAFQGVIPESKIIEFIEKSLGEKVEEDHSEFYNQIDKQLAENNFEDTKDVLEEFMANNPDEYKSFALYLECLSGLNLFEEINAFCESLNKKVMENKYIKSSLQKINIKKKNIDGPALSDLINIFQNDPKNLKNIIKLSDKYFAEEMLDESFELLLNNFKKDKDGIKKKLLEFFEALGNENEFTIKYRKKLSSILFS